MSQASEGFQADIVNALLFQLKFQFILIELGIMTRFGNRTYIDQ